MIYKKSIRIPLIKLDGSMRYVNREEIEKISEIRAKTSEEYQKLLYVELPSLINKIVNTRAIPMPVIPELIQVAVNEIEKITTAECDCIIEKYKQYLKKPSDEPTSND